MDYLQFKKNVMLRIWMRVNAINMETIGIWMVLHFPRVLTVNVSLQDQAV